MNSVTHMMCLILLLHKSTHTEKNNFLFIENIEYNRKLKFLRNNNKFLTVITTNFSEHFLRIVLTTIYMSALGSYVYDHFAPIAPIFSFKLRILFIT